MNIHVLPQPSLRGTSSFSADLRLYTMIFACLGLSLLNACSNRAVYPEPPRIGTDIVIDTSKLEASVPKFYTFRFHNKNINFFVIKMPDKILSFLDACASCYPHKKGYRYENDAIVCRYCNTKFPINKLEEGLGNCYPIKIEGRMGNGQYLIPAADLEKAAAMF
jgi:uncharacterized membrane protein